jgi:exonuclease III
MGLTETNISQRDGAFRNNNTYIQQQNYIGYWSDKDNKIKGSGVALLLHKKWEPYVGRVVMYKAYYIEITLFLKKCTLVIGNIYVPPSDKEMQKELLSFISKQHNGYHGKKFTHYNVMGDFNSVVEGLIDHKGPKHQNKKCSAIIRWLKQQEYVDAYRDANQDLKGYTWHKHIGEDIIVHSRIDHIWLDPLWSNRTISCTIYDPKDLTDSDHDILVAKVDFYEQIMHYSRCKLRSISHEKRKIYLYHKITKDQWDNYSASLEAEFRKNRVEERINTCNNIASLDHIWNIISSGFIKAADNNIPFKMVKQSRKQPSMSKEESTFQSSRNDMLRFRRLLRSCRQFINGSSRAATQQILHPDFNHEANILIAKINCRFECQIEYLSIIPTEPWVTQGSNWLKTIKFRIKQEENNLRNAQIRSRTDQRLQFLVDDQRCLINSVLERDSRRIVIDRI